MNKTTLQFLIMFAMWSFSLGPCDCDDPPKMSPVVFSGYTQGVRQRKPYYVKVDLSVVGLNLGSAYNETASEFTAPVQGVYFFSVTAVSNGNQVVPLELFKVYPFISSSYQTYNVYQVGLFIDLTHQIRIFPLPTHGSNNRLPNH